MLESMDRQQAMVAGGALNLTFISKSRQMVANVKPAIAIPDSMTSSGTPAATCGRYFAALDDAGPCHYWHINDPP
jgi:hypothetical protein